MTNGFLAGLTRMPGNPRRNIVNAGGAVPSRCLRLYQAKCMVWACGNVFRVQLEVGVNCRQVVSFCPTILSEKRTTKTQRPLRNKGSGIRFYDPHMGQRCARERLCPALWKNAPIPKH
jgi:hypothetical protein